MPSARRWPFDALTETQVEPFYDAWLKLSDDARKEMEQDFRDIDELATEGGSKTILDEAGWHGEDLARAAPRMEGERAAAVIRSFKKRPKGVLKKPIEASKEALAALARGQTEADKAIFAKTVEAKAAEGAAAKWEAAEAARHLGALVFLDSTEEALHWYRRAVEVDPANADG